MDDNWIEESTAGFYKQEGDHWSYAPNFVYGPTFELKKELKDTYTYPVEGWTWYDEQPYITETNEETNTI